MWECHATDILSQFLVQKFDATKGEFLVMRFQIDGPMFTTASFRKIVMERRVENTDSLGFADDKNTSQPRDRLARWSTLR